MDEYTVLSVFLAGILVQALSVPESGRGRLGVLLLAGLCGAGAWALAGRGADWRFDVPFLAALLFLLGFALFFRDELLPPISARALLHLALPAGYLFALQVRLHALPAVWLALPALPMAWLVGLAVRRSGIGRASRLMMYVTYLLLSLWLVPCQWASERLKLLLEESGFSLQVMVFSFTAGGVALVLAAQALYLLLLVPLPHRRTLLERVLEGPRDPIDEFTREHAGALIRKVDPGGIDGARAWLLLALHAVLLLGNALHELVSPLVAVNLSLAAVYTLLAPGRRRAIPALGRRRPTPVPDRLRPAAAPPHSLEKQWGGHDRSA